MMKKIRGLFFYWYLKHKGVETKLGWVNLVGLPIINKAEGSRIYLGRGTTLVSDPKYNPAGISHPVILATVSPKAQIIIKGECGISGATIVSASSVTIGRHAGLGADCIIYDTDFHLTDPQARLGQSDIGQASHKPVEVGENVMIGARAIILKGVLIGKGSYIGAGSVITKSVPDSCIVAGNPAKIVRRLL